MATAARLHTSVEEYLRSSYEVDCDLVDGELQERNLGEIPHSLMTMAIGYWFLQHLETWSLICMPDVRVQVRPDCYRVADIAVVPDKFADERILTAPPLIVIEILSPEDRIARYKERLADYTRMGVENIWVIDPIKSEADNCSSGDWVRTKRLEVPGTGIYLSLDELQVPGKKR